MKLFNLFRFIGDLNVMIDGGEFENSFKDICPRQLQLSKERSDNLEASFHDLKSKI